MKYVVLTFFNKFFLHNVNKLRVFPTIPKTTFTPLPTRSTYLQEKLDHKMYVVLFFLNSEYESLQFCVCYFQLIHIKNKKS